MHFAFQQIRGWHLNIREGLLCNCICVKTPVMGSMALVSCVFREFLVCLQGSNGVPILSLMNECFMPNMDHALSCRAFVSWIEESGEGSYKVVGMEG